MTILFMRIHVQQLTYETKCTRSRFHDLCRIQTGSQCKTNVVACLDRKSMLNGTRVLRTSTIEFLSIVILPLSLSFVNAGICSQPIVDCRVVFCCTKQVSVNFQHAVNQGASECARVEPDNDTNAVLMGSAWLKLHTGEQRGPHLTTEEMCLPS